VSTHVKVLAALFLGFGALGRAILGFTGLALTLSLLLASAPAIICGWGLLKFRPWARILAIVLGAVSLVAFPYGTVFGVYTLWVLLSKQTEAVFEPPTTSEPKTTSGVVSK